MVAVGLLTIGQSPRADLSAPLRVMRPDLHYVEAGALDGLSEDDLPVSTGAYPLQTRLRNGSQVTVDLAALEPLLQHALERLEDQGVVATMLMCAGTFDALAGTRPLLKPFALVRDGLHTAGIGRIGVVAPFAEQVAAIRARWLGAGFDVVIDTAPLADDQGVNLLLSTWLQGSSPVQAIVLDYVGHDPVLVKQLQARYHLPIFDLGLTTMALFAGIV